MDVAKSIARGVGTMIVGFLATWLAIPEWVVANLEAHPVQLIVGFITSGMFGGSVAYIAHSWHVATKLRSEAEKTSAELDYLRSERDRLCTELNETRRERDYAEKHADIVPGLSKAASEVYNRLEERDIEAMRRLAAASIVNHDGAPLRPLVMGTTDHATASLRLSMAQLHRLEEMGALRIHAGDDHVLWIPMNDGSIRQAEPGVSLDGEEAILDLPAGSLRLPLATGQLGGGTYASDPLRCADLGVAEYTEAGREVAGKVRTGDELDGLHSYIAEHWASGCTFSKRSYRTAGK